MQKKINLLSISFDKNIACQKFSDAQKRQLDYAKFLKNYTIIVLNSQKNPLPQKRINNLKIIPTNSIIKPLAIFDAFKIAFLENQKTSFNLITAQDPLFCGLTAIILKKSLNLPLNIQLHLDYHLDSNWLQERLINKLLIPLIKWEIHQADSLRVDNQTKIKKLKKTHPNLNIPIFQAPMRVDIKYFYKKVKKRKEIKNLVSVGRLIKQKNFLLLIKAMEEVVKKYPQTHLTIIGEGDQRKKIEALIKKKNLKKHIKLTGSLAHQKVKKILHQSDLFVLASNHESWGLVFVEAYAAGLPIVATRVASIGEILINNFNALVSPIKDRKKLTQKIIRLIKQPQKAYQLAKNGQKLIKEKFNKNQIIKLWINGLYETIKKT